MQIYDRKFHEEQESIDNLNSRRYIINGMNVRQRGGCFPPGGTGCMPNQEEQGHEKAIGSWFDTCEHNSHML